MLAFLLAMALAAPAHALPIHDTPRRSVPHARRQTAGSLPGLDFPASQTTLTVPAALYLNELALGVGFQKCVADALERQ